MNEEKFTGMGEIYAKYRPSYTNALIEYLYTEIGFNKESTIADIGAGTGILSKLLLLRGSTVIAVEPNDDMRKIAEQDLATFHNFISIKASAENTTIQNASVDFVTVAQAFHWFDPLLFQKECRRILNISSKPATTKGTESKVVLIWNSRDNTSEFVQECDRVTQQFCPDFTGSTGGRRGASSEVLAVFFENGIYESRMFQNDLYFNETDFIGRSLSNSSALKEGEPGYAAFVAALLNLFYKYSHDGVLHCPNIIKCYVGKV